MTSFMDAIDITSDRGIDAALKGYTKKTEDFSQRLKTGMEDEKKKADAKIAKADKEEAALDPNALTPPKLDPYVAPPKTQPLEAFGSAAGVLAALGGLLTRQPLTTSLNAASKVLDAYQRKDAAAAQAAFDEWKINTDHAIKLSDFQLNAYKAALSKVDSDRASAFTELKIKSAAFQDEAMALALEKGGLDEGVKIYEGQQKLRASLVEHGPQLAQEHEKQMLWLDWQKANPNATPQQRIAAYQSINAPTHAATDAVGWQVMTDPERTGEDGKTIPAKQYRLNTRTGEAKELTGDTPYEPFGAAKVGAKGTGAMGSRESVYTQRLIGAGNQVSKDLANIVRLPISSTSGIFGGRKQGPTLMDAGREVLANEMSKEDTQIYNVRIAGLQRQLAAIEAQGLLPSGMLTGQMEAVVWKEGDTNLVKMDKLAQIRQIVESGLETMGHNPRVSADEKKFIEDIHAKIVEAVPYTHADVSDLIEKQRENPEATMRDVMPKPSPEIGPDDRAAYDKLPPGPYRVKGDPTVYMKGG